MGKLGPGPRARDPPPKIRKIHKIRPSAQLLSFCFVFFLVSFQGGSFSVFEVLGTPKMEQKDLKIDKKSSQVAPGVPLGGKNVILAKLQHLPCEIDDFRGSEGPEICENHTES